MQMMQQMQTKILVVDDEDDIRQPLMAFLIEEGYYAVGAADAVAMDKIISDDPPDLIVLDLMLPGEDGLSICRRLRTSLMIPVIMVTARSSEVDRIVGLELGADDYVTKPFSQRELLARIRSVLRRGNATLLSSSKTLFRFKKYTIDLDARRIVGPSGQDVVLTSTEFDLLACFVQSPQKVLSRNKLLDLLHGRDADPFDRSIDTLVSRLRKKIANPDEKENIIATIRNHGYLFTPTVEIVSQ